MENIFIKLCHIDIVFNIMILSIGLKFKEIIVKFILNFL